jgi:hypothetical protein
MQRRPTALAVPLPAASRRLPPLVLAGLGGLLSALVAAGCGPGDNQRRVDSAAGRLPGDPAPVGSMKDAANDAHTAARETRDSVRAAGGGPAEGLDSLTSQAGRATTNDPTAGDARMRKTARQAMTLGRPARGRRSRGEVRRRVTRARRRRAPGRSAVTGPSPPSRAR